MRYAVATIAVLLPLLTSARGAEVLPPNPVPRDSLVEVKHDGHCWVIGLVDGKFREVATHDCPGTTVFCGPPGSYLVYGFEKEQRFQHVVEIVDGTPKPDPPAPDPPTPQPPKPDPPKPQPVPDSVERLYGIGPTAYTAALQTGSTAGDFQRLASAYRQASVYMHEMRLTPDTAQRQLRELRPQLSGNWSAWESQVEAKLSAALQKYGGGQLVWRDCFREIASALEAVTGRMTGGVPRCTSSQCQR